MEQSTCRHAIYGKHPGESTIYGFKPNEIFPDYGLALQQMHPDSRKKFLQAIDAALKGEQSFEIDYTIFRKDGREANLHTTGHVIRNESGAPVRMTGVVKDITQQKETEKLLRISEDKFKTIFEAANDGILIADAEKKTFVEANRTICTMLGYSKEELFGMELDDIHPTADLPAVLFSLFFSMVHPDDQPLLKKSIEETLQFNKPFNIDYRFNRKDGTTRIIRAMAELIPDSSGNPVLLSGTAQDITERKLVEEKIRKSESRLRESQEVARIGSWSWNLLDNTLEWSDETFRRFDKDPASFTPTVDYFISTIHPEDREVVRSAMEASLAHHQQQQSGKKLKRSL